VSLLHPLGRFRACEEFLALQSTYRFPRSPPPPRRRPREGVGGEPGRVLPPLVPSAPVRGDSNRFRESLARPEIDDCSPRLRRKATPPVAPEGEETPGTRQNIPKVAAANRGARNLFVPAIPGILTGPMASGSRC
jgi:hypothetical protein